MSTFSQHATDYGTTKYIFKSRPGLVQKEITVKGKNGTTFTRKQWVRAVPDNTTTTSNSRQHWTKVGTSDEAKKQIAAMLAQGKTREELMDQFKAAGAVWKESSNPGINWMRASMAMNRILTIAANAAQPKNVTPNNGSVKPVPVIAPINKDLTKPGQVYYGIPEDSLEEFGEWVSSGEPLAAAVWKSFENKIEIKDSACPKRAFFSAHKTDDRFGVHYNIKGDLKRVAEAKQVAADTSGNEESALENVRSEFSTLVHECFHNIDYLYQTGDRDYNKVYREIYRDSQSTDHPIKWKDVDKYMYFSSAYKDGLFEKTIHDEVQEHVNRYWKPRKKAVKAFLKDMTVENVDKMYDVGLFSHCDWKVKLSDDRAQSFRDTLKEYVSHIDDPTTEWWLDPKGAGFSGYYEHLISTPERRREQIYMIVTGKYPGTNRKSYTKDELWVQYGASKSAAYDAISNEIRQIPIRDRAGLSDIFEGATRCRVKGGCGHGITYWEKNPGAMSHEACANMGDAMITSAHTNSLKQLEKYFPRSVQVFRDMLSEMVGGTRG